ncbi:hypothetical protein QAD02_016908 [Eretmocerus hayati]|uniref:Uncharacterized protein n=1 Tax=Eretmocerus hayati TaxID=131215 RepID=A0ACC2PDN3_9HYME|nr:hypothetical protein QAD02_016908 [Eretmocerus hayati]
MRMCILYAIYIILPICVLDCVGVEIIRSNQKIDAVFSSSNQNVFRRSFEDSEPTNKISNRNNFNGKKLHLISTQTMNMSVTVDKNSSTSDFHTEMWTTLAQYLNFTIVFHHITRKDRLSLRNSGALSHMMENLSLDQLILPADTVDRNAFDALDYTFTLYESGCRFVMKPANQFVKFWMLNIYSRNVWFCIALLYLTMCFLSILNPFLAGKNLSHGNQLSWMDHVFSLFGVFCNQGNDFCMIYGNRRIFTFCAHVFSWLLLSCFSSQIYIVMTRISVAPVFSDFQSLVNDTDYTILLVNNSATLARLLERDEPIVEYILNSDRVRYVEDFKTMWEEACSDTFKGVGIQLETLKISDTLHCGLKLQQESFFRSHVAAGFSKNSSDKDIINYGIIRLIEVGIRNYLKDRWLNHYHPQIQKRLYSPISSEQVYLQRAIYLCGFCSSIIILVLEQIMHHGIPRFFKRIVIPPEDHATKVK